MRGALVLLVAVVVLVACGASPAPSGDDAKKVAVDLVGWLVAIATASYGGIASALRGGTSEAA